MVTAISIGTMQVRPWTVRNYSNSDLVSLLHLYERRAHIDTSYTYSPSLIKDSLRNPRQDPERDIFVAEEGGSLIGVLTSTPEFPAGWVVVEDAYVMPQKRRAGIGKALCEAAIERARSIGADRVQVAVGEALTGSRKLLENLGFQVVRRYLEMELDPVREVEAGGGASGLTLRPLLHGEEPVLMSLQNRAFAGDWGYNPNSLEDIVYRLGVSDTSHEDVTLALKDGEAIGYCWTTTDPPDVPRSRRRGRIYMLGVAPGARGKAAGWELLKAGVRHLKGRGPANISLTVDSENRTARRIYERAGFRHGFDLFWYELRLV